MNTENTVTIARKITLIPTTSPTKEWDKKIYEFTMNDMPKRIEKLKKKKIDKEDIEKEEERQQRLKELQEQFEHVKETREYTNDMVMNYTYDLVRTAMREEAQKKNKILSWIYTEMIENGVQYMDKLSDKNKFITDKINYAYRVKGSSNGSLFDETEIGNKLGGYGFAFKQALTGKIKDSVKNGLLESKISLPCYKDNSPFTIEKAHMNFSHDYDYYEELCEHIYEPDCNLYFDYGGNQKPTIARFKINVGTRKNRKEVLSTLLKVYSGEYKYCGSTVQIKKKKIVLNLTMAIPQKDMELDENTVVGVDLGVAIPAYCGLNNNDYYKREIGSANDFIRVRTQMQNQRKRVQESLKYSSGGHGRKKKLKALDRFKDRERNFAKTYNHGVSKSVVDFALKNRAKYINLENLKGIETDERILRNWSYFELQKQIEYKAAKYGIEVRKINPYHTSQKCSCCGHWEEGQRDSREFHCKKCGAKLHADFNASRNIAMSTDFKN